MHKQSQILERMKLSSQSNGRTKVFMKEEEVIAYTRDTNLNTGSPCRANKRNNYRQMLVKFPNIHLASETESSLLSTYHSAIELSQSKLIRPQIKITRIPYNITNHRGIEDEHKENNHWLRDAPIRTLKIYPVLSKTGMHRTAVIETDI